MKGAQISELPNEDLLRQFVELGLRQDAAVNLAQISKINQLGDEIHDISMELMSRSGDQRLVLMPLLSHPNANVRFNAAVSLIGIMQTEARQTIQTISDSNIYPITGHAASYLSMYDGKLSKFLRP